MRRRRRRRRRSTLRSASVRRGERTAAIFIYVACDGSARHVLRKCGAYGLPRRLVQTGGGTTTVRPALIHRRRRRRRRAVVPHHLRQSCTREILAEWRVLVISKLPFAVLVLGQR